MIRHLILATALTVGLLAPGAAIPPPVPIIRDYYGPVRACGRNFAFDAAEGEAYGEHGGSDTLRLRGGGIMIESWLYTREDVSDITKPLGTIEVPGGVRLQRIRMFSRNAPGSEILYNYETGTRDYFPTLSVRSNLFDGSDSDLALLSRVAFGEAARAMCAHIPEPLRPTPERENPDASWLDPRVHNGPITICMSGLALDVSATEAAMLPWTRRAWPSFRLIFNGGRVGDVDLRLWQPLSAQLSNAHLALNSTVAVHESIIPGSPAALIRDDGRGPAYFYLILRDPAGLRQLHSMPRVTFAFDRATTPEARLSVVRRVRVQQADDNCFAPVEPA